MSSNETELVTLRTEPSTAHRWNRGVWIRFVLAIAPTVAFAILGYLQTH
jgi:hypothetical protein